MPYRKDKKDHCHACSRKAIEKELTYLKNYRVSSVINTAELYNQVDTLTAKSGKSTSTIRSCSY